MEPLSVCFRVSRMTNLSQNTQYVIGLPVVVPGYALVAVTAAIATAAPFLSVGRPLGAAAFGGFSCISRFADTAVIAVTVRMQRSAVSQRLARLESPKSHKVQQRRLPPV